MSFGQPGGGANIVLVQHIGSDETKKSVGAQEVAAQVFWQNLYHQGAVDTASWEEVIDPALRPPLCSFSYSDPSPVAVPVGLR